MIRLKITSIFNQSTIYLIFLLLFILSFLNYYVILLLIILIIKFRKRFNLYILFSLVLVFSSSYYYKVNSNNSLINNRFVVEKYLIDYDEYIIVRNLRRYKLQTKTKLENGQIIIIDDDLYHYRKNTRPFSFNSYHYHLGMNIFGYYKNPKISTTNNFSNIIKFRSNLNEKLNNYNWYFNRDYTYQNNFNYLFLLVCSTYSLTLIYKIIRKGLFYLDISNNKQNLIIVSIHLFLTFVFTHIILVFYLLKLILSTVINYYNLNILKVDQYSFIFIVILIFNPVIIYNLSFIVYLLIIYTNLLLKNRNLSSLMIIPFHMLWFRGINLVSYFLMLFLKEFRIFGLILLTISSFINYETMNLKLNILNDLLNQINTAIPLIPYVNVGINFIIGFYLIITITYFLRLKYRNIILILILFLAINLNFTKQPNNRLYFLDVGQGNASIYLYNNEVIAIDCYDGVDEFLTNHKLKLHYLIITHNDYDHMRELSLLMTKYNPILIVGENSTLSNTSYHRKIKIGFNNANVLSDLDIIFYPLTKNSNENDNSLVLKINNSNGGLLFTGDISKSREKLLIDVYKEKIQTKGLVIAHHGSNTSSALEFIEHLKIEYALISVGYHNSYGMPNSEVINLLNQLVIKTYRTDHDGTIIIDFDNSNYQIKKIYKPYFKVGFKK